MNNSIINPKTSMLDLLYQQQNNYPAQDGQYNPSAPQVNSADQFQGKTSGFNLPVYKDRPIFAQGAFDIPNQQIVNNQPFFDPRQIGANVESGAGGMALISQLQNAPEYGSIGLQNPETQQFNNQNQQNPQQNQAQQNQAQQMQSGQTPNLQNPYAIPDAGTYNYTIPQMSTKGIQEQKDAIKEGTDAEARQAQKSAPIYKDIEKANQEYQQNLKSTQEKGEKDISESIEKQKLDAQDVANHQFLSKSDILNRMSGTDKVLSALGSIAGGISQGLLRSNSNPYWDQVDKLAESEIQKNNHEYLKLKDKLDNDKSMTETQRNLLLMRIQNMGQANVAQVNAFKSGLDSIAHDENLPIITRAKGKERQGQLTVLENQIGFQNQMTKAQYARDLGPTSERYVPNYGIAITKEAAEKIAPLIENQQLFNQSLNKVFRNRDASGRPVPLSQYRHEDDLEYKNMLSYAEKLGFNSKEIEEKLGNPSHYMVNDPNKAYQFLNNFVNNPTTKKINFTNHGLKPQPMYSSQQQVRQ